VCPEDFFDFAELDECAVILEEWCDGECAADGLLCGVDFLGDFELAGTDEADSAKANVQSSAASPAALNACFGHGFEHAIVADRAVPPGGPVQAHGSGRAIVQKISPAAVA
jgi:hypothetical protein